MAEVVEHIHRWEPAIDVKLKSLKGGCHTWEIDCSGTDLDSVLATVDQAHRRLEDRYGSRKEDES